MVDVRGRLTWGEPLIGTDADGASPSRLPAGTVTFLLSDIEGSTRLWSEFPDAMGSAVADSYAILLERSPGTRACGRSSRARVTASWVRSRGRPTRSPRRC